MFRENTLILINFFLEKTWIFAVIGLITTIAHERKLLVGLISKKIKKIRKFRPLLNRLLYIAGGFVLILLSFAVVNTVLETFLSPPIEPSMVEEIKRSDSFLIFLKYQAQFAGLISVIMLIVTGVCLMLSAGTKWLVKTAKLMATLAAFYLFISAIALYS